MEREPSRRRFITGCCVAGAGTLAASGLASGGAAEASERAAQPKTRWNRTYESGDGGTANAIAPADDGGYVVAGTTDPSSGENASVIWLYKISAAGRLVWEKTFAEHATTEAFDVAATDDGFIVAGHTHGEAVEGQDAFALRVDAEGVEQWRRVFHVRDSTTDTMRSVAVDGEGRFVFAGWTSRFDDAWVARLTDENKIDWAHRYGPGSRSRYHGVVPDSGGGYVVVGETADTSGDTAGWANKLDGEGVQQFSQQFKKNSNSSTNPKDDFNVFYDVAETRNGFVAVGANAFDPETNDQRGWALEFNVNGGKLWDKRYTEDNFTALYDVRYGNLEYFVVGETATDGEGTDGRGYAATLGIDGQEKWTGTWGSGSSGFSAFQMTDSGGFVSVGQTAESAGSTASGWAVQIGGDEVATATPSATPSPTPTPTGESPTPTFSPTPTDEPGGTVAAGDGDGTDTSAPTPTGTPDGSGGTEAPSDGGAGTTAGGDGGGGLSPTTIGIGAVILALGGGGVLYNRFLAGGDDDENVAGPGQGTGGAAPVDTGDGGGDGGDGDAETTEPATDENEDVQSAQTVVDGSESTGDAESADDGDTTSAADDGDTGAADGTEPAEDAEQGEDAESADSDGSTDSGESTDDDDESTDT
ncbi:hypothetical protein [Halosimplex sp. TS25]|uniref:hypothetical protein n=1 Tax=Halosimplex rarum TaxID=3396619 RepID=UPI0039ED750A